MFEINRYREICAKQPLDYLTSALIIVLSRQARKKITEKTYQYFINFPSYSGYTLEVSGGELFDTVKL